MLNKEKNLSCFETITQQELELNFDNILNRIEQGDGPFIIYAENGPDALLFGWEDYWERFGCLYPPGEKERVEEECKRRRDL